jgi:hypothetical protein
MTTMRTFDDHSLEFWGDVFQACRLAGEGVRFEDFIIDPQRILQDFGMDDAVEILESGFLPLLPKQAKVRARLERSVSSYLSAGGSSVRTQPARPEPGHICVMAA